MNLNEIHKIEDPTIREIRLKYWDLRHKSFLDDRNIKDTELNDIWNALVLKEEEEVLSYLNKQEEQSDEQT